MIAAEVSDYRELARRRVPHFLFEYLDGGAFSQTTLRRNVEDFQSIEVRQAVMRNVSAMSIETELFGQKISMPVALAPVGLSGLYARRGEIRARGPRGWRACPSRSPPCQPAAWRSFPKARPIPSGSSST